MAPDYADLRHGGRNIEIYAGIKITGSTPMLRIHSKTSERQKRLGNNPGLFCLIMYSELCSSDYSEMCSACRLYTAAASDCPYPEPSGTDMGADAHGERKIDEIHVRKITVHLSFKSFQFFRLHRRVCETDFQAALLFERCETGGAAAGVIRPPFFRYSKVSTAI